MAKKSKNTNPSPITTDLYISYSTNTHTTRARSRNDDWDRGNTASTHTLEYMSLAKPDAYPTVTYPGEVRVGDKVYLVYAVYSTGDSFGHDEDRCLDLISVHKDLDIARFNYQKVKDTVGKDYNYKLEISQDNGQVVTVSTPWRGYFESLSYVKVAGFTVRGDAPDGSEDDWYEEYN